MRRTVQSKKNKKIKRGGSELWETFYCHGLHFPLTSTDFFYLWCFSFFTSGNCLYLSCFYLLCFRSTHLSKMFWVVRKRKDNGIFNECQWCVWKEPVIGDKSLSCCDATETHLDVCVDPPFPLFLATRTVRLLPHAGLYFRKKNVRHQPLKYVPQWHFTLRACECVFPARLCRTEITKMIGLEKKKKKCYFRVGGG